MRIDVVTIFPDYLAPLELSLAGKARDKGLLDVHVHDLRDWTHDRHRTVDDTPYGGGAGMVMKPEPWGEALDAVLPDGADRWWCRRPSGDAVHPGDWPASWPARERLVFACGRYEGIDQRVRRPRRRPGPRSARSRSATTCSTAARWPRWRSPRPWSGCCPASWATPSRWSRSPTRTACWSTPSTPSRPRWRGRDVPPVLLSGDHAAIAALAARAGAYAVPPSAAPTCVHAGRAVAVGDVERRRAGAAAPTPGELLTLQRACWVQEPHDNLASRSRRCTSRSTTCGLAAGTRRSCSASAAGWSARSAAGCDGDALGHRPAHGRPRPAGPRARPAAARAHRGGGAARGDVVRAVHRRRQRRATSGCTRRPATAPRRRGPPRAWSG